MKPGSRSERTLAQKPSETCTTIQYFTQVRIFFLPEKNALVLDSLQTVLRRDIQFVHHCMPPL